MIDKLNWIKIRFVKMISINLTPEYTSGVVWLFCDLRDIWSLCEFNAEFVKFRLCQLITHSRCLFIIDKHVKLVWLGALRRKIV